VVFARVVDRSVDHDERFVGHPRDPTDELDPVPLEAEAAPVDLDADRR
jgi:hypothetical protein